MSDRPPVIDYEPPQRRGASGKLVSFTLVIGIVAAVLCLILWLLRMLVTVF